MRNKNQKTQISVSQKIISEYAEKIILYMKENKSLKTQLEDLRITLTINKDMLNNQIKSLASNTKINVQLAQIISSLQEENIQISNRNVKLYNDNLQLETKLYKCQQDLNDKIRYYEKIIKELEDKIFILENKLVEKDNLMKQYKNELMKYYKEDLNPHKEIYICPAPDQFNMEMNNELYEARQIITKYSHLLNDSNKLNSEYKTKISLLKEIINDIKKGKRIKRNLENIENFDYILTEDSNLNSSSSSDKNSIQFDIDSDYLKVCDSPLVQCPSKIKQKRYLTTTGKNNSCDNFIVPKLDLSNIINKYKPVDKTEISNNNNNDKTIVFTNQKLNDNDKDYIDKLIFKLKFYIEMNKKYKQKFKEQKQIISMLKNHCLKNINNNNTPNCSTADTKKRNNNNDNSGISINYKDGYSIENNVNFSMDSDNFDIENEMNIIINELNKEAVSNLSETNNYYKGK